MTLPFSVFVRGLPHTKGAMKPVPNRKTGSTMLVPKDPGGKQRSWQQAIQWVVQEHWEGPPAEGPLRCDLVFVFPRPKSASKRNPPVWHDKSGYDRSKLLRLVEDALEGVVCRNDGQLCDGTIRKRYGDEPGLYIRVRLLHSTDVAHAEHPD